MSSHSTHLGVKNLSSKWEDFFEVLLLLVVTKLVGRQRKEEGLPGLPKT